MSDSEWVTLEEAAAQLRKTPRQINEYCKEGKLEFHKMAGKTYVSDESIGIFLELYEGKRRGHGPSEEEEEKQVVRPAQDKGIDEIEAKRQKEIEVRQQEPRSIPEEHKPEVSRLPEPISAAAPESEVKRPPAPVSPEQNEKRTEAPARKYGEAPAKPERQVSSSPPAESSSWKPSAPVVPPAREPEKTMPTERPIGSNTPVTPSRPIPPTQNTEPTARTEPAEPAVPRATTSSPSDSGSSHTLPEPTTPKPLIFTSVMKTQVETQPTEPANIKQEVASIVNNLTSPHSSELLSSIRNRIVAHEASEKDFCEEMRGLVDALESAFKEEEGKAGQLTQELSNLLSRYAAQERPSR